MRFPERIKIGGKVYQVEQTRNLDLGNVNYSGEIDYQNLIIRVVPAAKEKMEGDLIHEVIHGVLDFLGYRKHNEKNVEEMAGALHMVIKDNPQIFEMDGENNESNSN